MFRWYSSRFVLISLVSAAAWLPAQSRACSYGGVPSTDAQLENYHRQILPRLTELFEAEVLTIDWQESEMRVTRVFRGRLRPAMILKGSPATTSCAERQLQVGDRGIAWVSFGPGGPSFVSEFLNERAVQSLRRIGALPAE